MRALTGKRLEKELARLETMAAFDAEYDSFSYICGIDEAGRGPLAGPVAAGAVILPKGLRLLYLNDSKKVSPARREELFSEIREKAVSFHVGIVPAERIDEINILQADYEAMRIALQKTSDMLKAKGLTDKGPDLLLNDAVTIPDVEIEQIPIIKGDAKSVSIAAASIIAKETRDAMLMELDQQYPEYGFASHKGYGTPQHIQAIKEYGPLPVHRRSFIKNFIS